VQFLQTRTASAQARRAFPLADGTSLHWHDPCKSEDRVEASRHRRARRLHAVYRYWGETEPLDAIIARMYRCYVMEVNDDPNIDAGNEDGVLKDALYRAVLGVFLRRIRERGAPVEA
jgi:hypothetical protein